jgi:hypothetical protein
VTSTKTTATPTRIERGGHLQWVAIADLHVNGRAQRELRPGWAAQIAAEFDPDRFLPPLVSKREHKFYVIDGQHRIEAMRVMGWADQQIQCWVYEGLSEADEADLFLWHNNTKPIQSFDKFQIGVTANRSDETDINRIVLAQGLKVAQGLPASVSATSALRKVYGHGPHVLARTLRIVKDSYGDDGLKGHVVEGIGLLAARHNGSLNDEEAVRKLSSARGGLGALNTKAYTYRKQLGRPLPHCVAAAATEIINAGKGGKKLPNWWS